LKIPEAACETLLQRWPVARLATLGAEGTPRIVPLVFVWHEGRIWSPVDGKPKRTARLARLQDVERDARVCLLLDHYADDWSLLWWLRLDGRAGLRTADALEADASLASAARALRTKYPQYATTALFLDRPQALVMQVERTRSWCAGPEAVKLP